MPFFQVRQRVTPSSQYRLRSEIKAIVAIETVLRLPHPACLRGSGPLSVLLTRHLL